MFDKILIANRGEIACRVMPRPAAASASRASPSIRTPTRDAKHVARPATKPCRLGGAAAADSYLRGERIIDAARATGAQAIHPGYGFLSENADFAEACEAAGIVFIGPPVAAIAAMGSKAAAKALMHEAGVPLVPGYHGDDQDAGAAAARGRRDRLPGAAQGQRRRRRQGHARGRALRRFPGGARVLPARGRQQLRQRPRADREIPAAPAPRGDPGVRRHAGQ